MNFTDLRIIKTRERLQNALLELLGSKELKAITVKEICEKAGISRNAFYQHFSYKEDLYEQMVDKATERIRDSLTPLITDVSQIKEDTVASYAIHIIDGVSEVRGLMYVMLKSDEGIFLRQLTDLIYNQVLTNSCSFFGINETKDLQLFYEFLSAGMAAFIIKLVLDKDVTEERAAALLTEILRQISITIPLQLGK